MPLALAVVLLVLTARAQVYDDLQQAWRWEQSVRQECRVGWQAPSPEPARVREAIARLRGLLDYFADPRAAALTAGDFGRQPEDILTDLALAHAALGEEHEVAANLDALRARLDGRQAPLQHYLFDVDRFCGGAPAALRARPAVAAALQRLGAKDPWQRFRARSLASPFAETLAVEERVAGLSLLWSEVKYNFANFDLVPQLDWDAAYLAALPKAIAAADTLAFYRVLQELCAQLHDAHTNVNLPDALRRRVEARPPLRATLLGGRVFVERVPSKKLAALGLEPGQEIVRVDGEGVVVYAERTLGAYVCSSTPQDRAVRLFGNDLLRGPPDRPVALSVAVPGGEVREIAVPRSGYDDVESLPGYALRVRPDGVAVVAIATFEDNAVVDSFERDLPRILEAKALVLDLRENGGGSSDLGYAILAHLTAQPFRDSRWRTLDYRPALRAWNQAVAPFGEEAAVHQPAAAPRFAGPVALLIGPRTFSAAEDFAVAFDALRRGPLVGLATGGSTGQPLVFHLPGGGAARVCTKRDTYPDGKEFVGVGVQPTVPVAPTAQDLQQGRDPVLELAVQELLAAPAAGGRPGG